MVHRVHFKFAPTISPPIHQHTGRVVDSPMRPLIASLASPEAQLQKEEKKLTSINISSLCFELVAYPIPPDRGFFSHQTTGAAKCDHLAQKTRLYIQNTPI